MKNAILRHSIPSSSLASPSISNPISSPSRHQSHSGFGPPHQHHPLSPTATDKEKLRFEVHSTPSMRGHQPQKWYMKANHPVEAARWIQAIGRSIEWARKESGGVTDAESTNDQEKNANADSGRRRSGESDNSVSASLQSSFSQRATATAGRVSGSILRRGRGHLYRTPRSERESARSMVSHPRAGAGDTGDRDVSGVSLIVSPDDLERERDTPSDGDGDDEGGETQDDSSAAESRGKEGPPHEESYELQGNSVAAQMELTVQLLANLGDGASADGKLESSKSSLGTGSSVPSSASVSPRLPSVPVSELGSSSSSFQRLPQVQLRASSPEQMHLQPEAQIVLTPQSLRALRTSFSTTHTLLTEYTNMVQDREAWWRRTLEKERKSQKAWEESLATVVKEGETLERELRARSRRRGSRFFDVGAGESATGTIKGRRGNVLGRTVEEGVGDGKVEASYFPSQEEQASPEPEPQAWRVGKRMGTAPRSDMTAPPVPPKSPTTPVPRRTSTVALRSKPPLSGSDEEIVGADTDEEDEFFDAIEYGTLPDLVVPQELTSPSTLHAVPSMPSMFNDAVYGGYKNLRTQLNLSEERPPTSLWSVLKHSIGKDLTRISFPVFFNEPTSMLQRMAEDMEFSECREYFPFSCLVSGI
jgi:hypothetical protein